MRDKDGEFYPDFLKFLDYYGQSDYANDFITAAFEGGTTMCEDVGGLWDSTSARYFAGAGRCGVSTSPPTPPPEPTPASPSSVPRTTTTAAPTPADAPIDDNTDAPIDVPTSALIDDPTDTPIDDTTIEPTEAPVVEPTSATMNETPAPVAATPPAAPFTSSNSAATNIFTASWPLVLMMVLFKTL